MVVEVIMSLSQTPLPPSSTITFLESTDSYGHGCLGVPDLVGLVQNHPVPVDLEQCGAGGNTAPAPP